ncbi:MAG TPA: pilus assembly protein FimV, partial [Methylococcaceae bacterium]|nr:pilus assembly protein FimV [Methylococcaceae bacterium]
VKPADVADIKAPEAATPTSEENNNLALYGGGLALALLGLFLVRRRKQNDETQSEEQISEETPDFTSSITENNDTSLSATTILEEEPLLSEFTPSEFNSSTQTQEADPLTECDVYIAYGRFQQAEDLINKALEDDPDNQAYKFKLLDVYFASSNSEAFEDLANSLSTLKDSDPDTWSDIVDMGKDLCPESPLFATPQNEELDTSSDIEQEINPGMSFEETDDVEEVKIEETPAESKENGDFDFDFDLIKPDTVSEDTHENIETLFSLAQASIEMEDFESARETLEQIIATGDEEEKQKAQEMLDEM